MMSIGSCRLNWFKSRMQKKSFPEAEVSANFAGLRVGMESVVALGLFTIGLYHRRLS